MADKKVAIGVGLGLIAIVGVALMAKAGPAREYVCPYCFETFDNYTDLVAHVQEQHPGERIPLPIDWE